MQNQEAIYESSVYDVFDLPGLDCICIVQKREVYKRHVLWFSRGRAPSCTDPAPFE